jgi:hypothetical protein
VGRRERADAAVAAVSTRSVLKSTLMCEQRRFSATSSTARGSSLYTTETIYSRWWIFEPPKVASTCVHVRPLMWGD